MKNSIPASSITALIERWKAEKRELEVLLDRADEMPDDTEDSYQLKEAARATVGARLSQLDMVCPIFCTSLVVSVAQLSLSIDSRSRGCGEVGSA
jgi:hypothetical protein